jgi:hypothetical protein
MGTWLFWSPRGASVYVDMRDAEPAAALGRLQPLLTPAQQAALQHWRTRVGLARPWACRLDADDDAGGDALDDAGDQGRTDNGGLRVQLHWLYPRGDDPSTLLQHWRPGAWDEVLGLLGHLLKRPERAGRWVLATPLDDEGPQALHVGNSGWALVPEDEAKHRAIASLAAALGARADQAQALWSLCRATAAGRGHRMGRACEIRLSGAGQPAPPRARLFISPAA